MSPIPYRFVPAERVLQAELIFQYQNQTVENVVHFQFNNPLDGTEFSDLGAKLVAWWNTNLKPIVRSATSLQQIKITDLSSQTAPVVYYSTGLPIPGTYATGVDIPTSVTCAIRFTTAKRGRNYRGRLYHVGLDSIHVVGNQLTAGVASSFTTYYTALLTPGTVNSSHLVVLSRVLNGAWREVAEATPVTAVYVDQNVDNQRRRLTARGR